MPIPDYLPDDLRELRILQLYHRQNWITRWWMKRRGTKDAWMTSAFGIGVPDSCWMDGTWTNERYSLVRKHEYVGHYLRISNRPWPSRIWWCIHYMLSKKMRFDEETWAFRIEAAGYVDKQQQIKFIEWATDTLIKDYGFGEEKREEIVKAISFGL